MLRRVRIGAAAGIVEKRFERTERFGKPAGNPCLVCERKGLKADLAARRFESISMGERPDGVELGAAPPRGRGGGRPIAPSVADGRAWCPRWCQSVNGSTPNSAYCRCRALHQDLTRQRTTDAGRSAQHQGDAPNRARPAGPASPPPQAHLVHGEFVIHAAIWNSPRQWCPYGQKSESIERAGPRTRPPPIPKQLRRNNANSTRG